VSGVPLIKQSGRTDQLDSLPAIYKGKPGTIAYWGCALTSSVMLINYYGEMQNGFSTTPEQLNAYLKSRPDGYAGAAINWVAVADYAKTVGHLNFFYKGRIDERDDFTLDSYVCNGLPAILGVNHDGHFVVGTGQTTINNVDTYTINDPAAYPNDTTLQPFNYTYSSLRLFSPTPSDPSALYVIALSPVELLLTSPGGLKTGFGGSTGSKLTQIPSSSYGTEALLDDVDLGTTLTTPEVKILEVLTPASGTYAVSAVGTGSGTYTLNFWGYDNTGHLTATTFTGTTFPGATANFTVSYASSAGGSLAVTRNVTIQGLLTEINIARKINAIDNDGIANSLSAKVEAAQAAANRGDSQAEQGALGAFINEVSAQSAKHIQSEAADVLISDANALIVAIR